MSLPNFFRRLGAALIWLTSAYVLLMLVIALTEQGRPTGTVFSINLGELFYPEWYANPLVVTAVKWAVFAYPAAALCYGIASLARSEKSQAAKLKAESPGAALPAAAGTIPLPPLARSPDRLTAGDAARPPTVTALSADYPESPDNLCILDMAFFIRSISHNAASVLGLSPSAVRRRPFTNFVLPADISQLHAAWDRLLSDPQAVITLQLRIRRPDDVLVEADALCRAGLGADGRIVSMLLLPRSPATSPATGLPA